MTQQDYTAPEWGVRVSRKERFQQVFEVYESDGITPDGSLVGLFFYGDLLNQSGIRVAQASCTRPAAHAVLVDLSTAQMNSLRAGQYSVEVYGLTGGEREDLIRILLTVE